MYMIACISPRCALSVVNTQDMANGDEMGSR